MINLTEFAKEVHENSVAHGWWETDREYYELVALFHCEISEAMEEYRAGRPMVWYGCKADDHVHCEPNQYYYTVNCCKSCGYRKHKPEGIAVELVDLVLRILDYLGKEQIDVPSVISPCGCSRDCIEKFPKFIAKLHDMISTSFTCYEIAEDFNQLSKDSDDIELLVNTVSMVMYWFEQKGVDFEEVLLMKHEYNKTRPYKHGGKLL